MYKNQRNIIQTLNDHEPWLLLLVGVPMAGKSTFVKEVFPDVSVVSRDDSLMILANERGLAYSEAFHEISPKKVNKLFNKIMTESAQSNENVINDMTNLGIKRRRSNMAQFGKHYTKFAVVFETPSWDELMKRNHHRKETEGKWIPEKVIQNFIDVMKYPSKEEGFKKIWKI